ncbi:MAG TPA: hypothetical protein VF604_14795 [Pyrinomonadaceae bacterium]|jgi:hypothetical protein
MKLRNIFAGPDAVAAFVFFLACFIAPSFLLAQTDKTIENKTPLQTEIPKPQAVYEYLAPQSIVNFMYAVKEAGQRGFRLDKLTAVPSGEAGTSKEKAGRTVLAGIVRYDGENRYDYNFFFAEGEKEADNKLNLLADKGWYFREVVTVYGGGADTDPSGLFENTVYSLPTVGNLYLLERVSQAKSNRQYKLLKAGVGIGKNPTEKMQSLLNEAVREDYVPVATYYSFGVTSIVSVDSFFAVLVEKSAPGAKPEYRFIRGNRNEGLRKEIDKVTAEGYRLGVHNLNSAVMIRDAEKSAPVAYQWVLTDRKDYAANLTKVAESDAEFYSVGVDMASPGDFVKSVLIFRNKTAGNANRFEYRTLRMIPPRPKKQKKGAPVQPPPAQEKPEDVFKKMLADGYTPRDLFYSDEDSLNVFFERRK